MHTNWQDVGPCEEESVKGIGLHGGERQEGALRSLGTSDAMAGNALFTHCRVVENTILSVFTFAAFSVMFLYIRCTAINPSDKTSSRKKRLKSVRFRKLNYWFILSHIVARFFRRWEKKILRHCIRRTYLDPWKTSIQMEPLLPFPLVVNDDAVTPDLKEDDISFCALCDVELIVEGGTAVAIFIRCFADRKGIEKELEQKLFIKFPRGILAAISAFLALMTAYGSAALGQLFFFHVVLIRKGMRTYDYILAMREENQSIEPFDDSDSSSDDESFEYDSPRRHTLMSKLMCSEQKTDEVI
ncbi:hypothetical protein ACLOJK_022102 [Asimina triloba]